MKNNFYIFLLLLFSLQFYSFSQNNPYLAMQNLNNWEQIPYVDDFGDVMGIDHYGLLSECVKVHDPSKGTYWSENKGYIYFNVNKEMMGIFFYQEDRISATKNEHWSFDPEVKYSVKVKRQDNSVVEFPMHYEHKGAFKFDKWSEFYKLVNHNPTGEELKLAIMHKGEAIHLHVIKSRKHPQDL